MALPQMRERRHKVRPGVELVPPCRDRAPIPARKGRDAAVAEKFVEHFAMDIIDVEVRLDGTEHPPQRASPIIIGERMPVVVDTAPRAALGEHGGDAPVPIENCPSGVKGQYLDPVHACSAQPVPRTRAAGTIKLPAISLSRSSWLARQVSRRAWIAAPAAVSFQNQSPSC